LSDDNPAILILAIRSPRGSSALGFGFDNCTFDKSVAEIPPDLATISSSFKTYVLVETAVQLI
jgi:hypothetical protein